ncbi:helix-turn-helix transcriptional regulator [Neisseria sp. HMSC063B05]|uniref:helix-turn-helix domain-containing protein n=1 Tax=Neisseria sp. HMSC063B05 TaxID=1739328 RepID=UPI0008A3EFC7|nr:helix-turn-helix transcriptional regulator [Neisseria sp. HMSC063B05]OFR95846.1 hypothetical protein HMPREF2824_06600 [Neisseria sp. HMSC063B05]
MMMKIMKNNLPSHNVLNKEDFSYLFDFSDFNTVDLSKEKIASSLAALISYSGIKRKDLAKKLKWKESRLSKALSGRQNLTLKSITEITVALGYDFDIIFHKDYNIKPYIQPWEINQHNSHGISSNISITITFINSNYNFLDKNTISSNFNVINSLENLNDESPYLFKKDLITINN